MGVEFSLFSSCLFWMNCSSLLCPAQGSAVGNTILCSKFSCFPALNFLSWLLHRHNNCLCLETSNPLLPNQVLQQPPSQPFLVDGACFVLPHVLSKVSAIVLSFICRVSRCLLNQTGWILVTSLGIAVDTRKRWKIRMSSVQFFSSGWMLFISF